MAPKRPFMLSGPMPSTLVDLNFQAFTCSATLGNPTVDTIVDSTNNLAQDARI
jgi:hypothetical protein